MHEHLQSLLQAGWKFELRAENNACRAIATKPAASQSGQHGIVNHVGRGFSIHPIEALAQSMESAQMIEDKLRS